MNGAEKDNLEFELSRYLDGQLSGRRARALERRLGQDPELRKQLNKYSALEERLAGLASRELPGADYDWQRQELLRQIERRRLLERPVRRTVFLRPVFWVPGGGLAVAAAVIIGIITWMSPTVTPPNRAGPAEVSVALVAPPSSSREGQAQVSMHKLTASEYRLIDAAPGEIDVLADNALPPGTVMASVNTVARPARPRSETFPFPMEF